MTPTEIQPIVLNKLDADPKNVRKTYAPDSVESLAASIGSVGVLQNLVVRPGKKGRFFVSAGGRRLAALKLLVQRGTIPADHAVNCQMRDEDSAVEVSLAENVMREAMHPLDEFEAFKALSDQGKSPDQIASRFGVTENLVKRRLALAKTAPELRELFRSGEIELSQLAAFTVVDDHARQLEVWNNLGQWNRHSATIRRMLLSEQTTTDTPRFAIVGEAAYLAASGILRKDLFDESGSGIIESPDVLEAVFNLKVEAVKTKLLAEGWAWVEFFETLPDWYYGAVRVYPTDIDLSPEDQAALDALENELENLTDLDSETAPVDPSELEQRQAALHEQIEQFNRKTSVFTETDYLTAGAIISVSHYGKFRIERGMMARGPNEDAFEDEQDVNEDHDHQTVVPTEPEPAKTAGLDDLSFSLVEDLSARKTAALRVALADNPDIALVTVIHAMLLRVGYSYAREQSAVQVSVTPEYLKGAISDYDDYAPVVEFASMWENLGHSIPGNPTDLWDWLIDKSTDELLILLAAAAAKGVNVVEKKFSDRGQAFEHGKVLSRALSLDMADWFTPTAENYFKRISKDQIVVAIKEAIGDEEAAKAAKMKKGEAAAYAETLFKDRRWLPPQLRAPVPQEPAC
ncbi:putative DNA-binding protein [Devosia sp. LC5]|uniref:ParB/RepB/Spo0J family partition protein n=1 Tax=Devosia sp. LC5 TaxID=1502724 RepID=UPI0004E2BC32|nr:ParB/RepB/Spo0J family partition protein [Devosia sp. LC5]KFC70271.1 putative DNA-binding protein [Devosia sp. LC5]